jgi:hypothetical protein
MIEVRFSEVNSDDENDYLFIDGSGTVYHLFSDSRGLQTLGVTPDFLDKFYFCEKIRIDYKSEEGVRFITKVISYK